MFDVFMMYHHTTFYMPTSCGIIDTYIKMKVKNTNICNVAAMLCTEHRHYLNTSYMNKVSEQIPCLYFYCGEIYLNLLSYQNKHIFTDLISDLFCCSTDYIAVPF
jgi:hypothetical protein